MKENHSISRFAAVQTLTRETKELLYIEEHLLALLALVKKNQYCFSHSAALFEDYKSYGKHCLLLAAQMKEDSPFHHALYIYLLNLNRMFHSNLGRYFLSRHAFLVDLFKYCKQGREVTHVLLNGN